MVRGMTTVGSLAALIGGAPPRGSEGLRGCGTSGPASVAREDSAVRADHVGDALRQAVDRDGTEGPGDSPLRVGDEVERESILLAEGPMGGFVLDADAEDHGPDVSECVRVLAEGAGFAGAAERVVLRVEEEDDVLAPQVPEPDGHTVLVVPFEVRRQVARFEQVDQSTRPIRS